MLRLVSIAVLFALLVPTVLTASGDSWIGRAGGGFAGEVASLAVVGGAEYAYSRAAVVNLYDWDQLGAVLLGFLVLTPGMPAATAGGVCWAGQAQGKVGRYWAAYLGAVAGTVVGYGIVGIGGATMSQHPYVLVPMIVAGVAAPAIGATIGYDLSRSRMSARESWQERLMPPAVAVIPEHRAGHERTTRIDARLLAVRF
jgi:hypothetical protein